MNEKDFINSFVATVLAELSTKMPQSSFSIRLPELINQAKLQGQITWNTYRDEVRPLPKVSY